MWFSPPVMTGLDPLPDDLAAAHAVILAERAARLEAEERVSAFEAEVSSARLEIGERCLSATLRVG